MPRYVYKGDYPRSIPEYGIDRVEPGETVETLQELEHPDFQPAKKAELKATDKVTEKEAEAQPVPSAQPASELKVDKAKS